MGRRAAEVAQDDGPDGGGRQAARHAARVHRREAGGRGVLGRGIRGRVRMRVRVRVGVGVGVGVG